MFAMAERRRALPLLALLALAAAVAAATPDPELLLEVKAGLDPQGEVLVSWIKERDPCSSDSFVGVGCDSQGRITNISLQGRGLTGSIPAAIGQLSSLTALYLHYNSLTGSIPASLGSLAGLTDLYLNVNKLSGTIPSQLSSLRNIQALQLCCNDLGGRIPDSLGHLGLLGLLALQHNHLEGPIPASLGQLTSLRHLDLSFNRFSGAIPAALNNLGQIAMLDVRSNQLSGYVPAGLRSLDAGFFYANNSGLCGVGFPSLPYCSNSGASSLQHPEPFGAVPPGGSAAAPSSTNPRHLPGLLEPQAKPGAAAATTVPQTMVKHTPLAASSSSRIPQMAVVAGVVAVTGGVLLAMLMSFVWFRRHKQRISSSHDSSGAIKVAVMDVISPEQTKSKDGGGNRGSSLHLVAPLALQSINAPKALVGSSMRSFQYRLEELEVATNYFSEKYLLARKSSLSIYRAMVRDGSTAVIKYFTKTRFVGGGEEELEATVSSLMQLKHDNLVKLKGYCCVKGGLQCYLVYDHVPNGSLFEHLHSSSESSCLDWGTRVHIAHGVAKGLDYLHRNGEQVIVWASNVLLDESYNALVSSWGHNKILADELVYANIKTSAMLGYLAPEYGVVGHLDDKSDVYAFGILLLELLTGRKPMYGDGSSFAVTNLANFVKPIFESGHLDTVLDPALGTKFSATGAAGMASIAFSCVAAVPGQRPSIGQVVQRLYEIETLADGGGGAVTAADAGFSSSGEEYPSYPNRQQAAYAEMLDYGR